MPRLTTRNDAKVRETTRGYAKGVDGVNGGETTWSVFNIADPTSPHALAGLYQGGARHTWDARRPMARSNAQPRRKTCLVTAVPTY